MLYWAVVFLVVALVAGVLGFGGIAAASVGIAKVLFFVFVILFIISLVMGMRQAAADGLTVAGRGRWRSTDQDGGSRDPPRRRCAKKWPPSLRGLNRAERTDAGPQASNASQAAMFPGS